MNLTCTTSASNPQANITWYKSSVDITNQSTFTVEEEGGLARTKSSLRIVVVKEDNGKQVYCRASNAPNKIKTSSMQTLNVMCKCTGLYLLFTRINKTVSLLKMM